MAVVELSPTQHTVSAMDLETYNNILERGGGSPRLSRRGSFHGFTDGEIAFKHDLLHDKVVWLVFGLISKDTLYSVFCSLLLTLYRENVNALLGTTILRRISTFIWRSIIRT